MIRELFYHVGSDGTAELTIITEKSTKNVSLKGSELTDEDRTDMDVQEILEYLNDNLVSLVFRLSQVAP